jgi:16S rRNA (cytosine967-C5)-methyltransferase
MNEASALRRTINQLKIEDSNCINEAKQLIFNVLKCRNTLDYIINEALAPKQLNNLGLGLRNFLRLYTYLFHFCEKSFQEAHNLTYHVRKRLKLNEFEQVEEAIDIIPHIILPWKSFTRIKALSLRYFHPPWYIEYLEKHFNEKKVVKMIEYYETPKYFRINTLKATENTLDSLTGTGIQFAKVSELKYTYKIMNNPGGLVHTKSYCNGELLLQDKASIIVGEIAAPKSTDLVLDICAAPGVKTTHLAQLMNNKGRIISVDYSKRRLESWKKMIKKMGVLNAKPVLADATKPGGLPNEMADIVLLDPPCTGTGTFNESPSGKWRINRNSIQQMANLQKKLIDNASVQVVKGGSLIYSTCSVTYDENEAIIIDFLEKNPSFTLKRASPCIGEPGLGLSYAQRFYPYIHGCQGFFVVRLEKNN